jgi:hypothetical protein
MISDVAREKTNKAGGGGWISRKKTIKRILILT